MMAMSGNFGGELLQHLAGAGDKGRDLDEIARRVSADRKFGKDDQVSSTQTGVKRELAELGGVAGKVSDSGVDLSECDLHRNSVKRARG